MKTIKRPTGSIFDKPKDEIDAKLMREIIDIGNNQIWPHVQQQLAGRPPHVQTAILAHVTSLWLSAYSVNGVEVTEPMLVKFISMTRQLLTLNSQVLERIHDKAAQ